MADYPQPGSPGDVGAYSGPSAHPYLHNALLYITNVPDVMSDELLAAIFTQIGPFRPKINREAPGPTKSGTIEFKSQAMAEKALATVPHILVPGLSPPTRLGLSPYPPTDPPTPLPPASALPRIVKHLPPALKETELYDIFRPFGALASVRTHVHGSTETGIVEFWNEDDARQAEKAMHCSDLDGKIISVQIYNTNRRSVSGGTEFSVNAPAFVPTGSMFGYPNATYSPPRGPPSNFTSPRSISQPLPGSPFIHGPGQQVQLAPPTGPGSTSHSGLIDPCNLFIKNLDPSIDSNALFSHFRSYGRIVSARVMRNGETGESRGFGFVSFETPDQASSAMQSMNGVQLGSKQVIVRLHEPKQLRQEKLAARFASNGHPRNASGATSPTISEGGESLIAGGRGSGSPRHYATSNLSSPVNVDAPPRGRRGSGSYYNAALSGTLNLPMKYDDLATLSPVVRQEVLTGELIRRVKSMDVVPSDEVDNIVDRIVGMSLSDVVKLMDNNDKLKSQVMGLSPTADDREHSATRSSTSQDSRLLTAEQLNATASAPDHPSTPISMSTPPRTASPPPPISTSNASERERIFDAVNRFESSRQEELTDLLMSLPKRERAMCLFNAEVLRAKLADAKLVLESTDDDDYRSPGETAVPVTPQPKKTAPKTEGSPHTPDLSSRGPSAASSPQPTTPSSVSVSQYSTVASLSKLPAAEVVRLAFNSTPGLPVEKADKLVVQSTDEFIDSLMGKAVQQQKQALGDKLFRVVKSFGVKSAPKITIALLDQEDLRALAHLMNSYPAVLKEKALTIASAGSK